MALNFSRIFRGRGPAAEPAGVLQDGVVSESEEFVVASGPGRGAAATPDAGGTARMAPQGPDGYSSGHATQGGAMNTLSVPVGDGNDTAGWAGAGAEAPMREAVPAGLLPFMEQSPLFREQGFTGSHEQVAALREHLQQRGVIDEGGLILGEDVVSPGGAGEPGASFTGSDEELGALIAWLRQNRLIDTSTGEIVWADEAVGTAAKVLNAEGSGSFEQFRPNPTGDGTTQHFRTSQGGGGHQAAVEGGPFEESTQGISLNFDRMDVRVAAGDVNGDSNDSVGLADAGTDTPWGDTAPASILPFIEQSPLFRQQGLTVWHEQAEALREHLQQTGVLAPGGAGAPGASFTGSDEELGALIAWLQKNRLIDTSTGEIVWADEAHAQGGNPAGHNASVLSPGPEPIDDMSLSFGKGGGTAPDQRTDQGGGAGHQLMVEGGPFEEGTQGISLNFDRMGVTGGLATPGARAAAFQEGGVEHTDTWDQQASQTRPHADGLGLEAHAGGGPAAETNTALGGPDTTARFDRGNLPPAAAGAQPEAAESNSFTLDKIANEHLAETGSATFPALETSIRGGTGRMVGDEAAAQVFTTQDPTAELARVAGYPGGGVPGGEPGATIPRVGTNFDTWDNGFLEAKGAGGMGLAGGLTEPGPAPQGAGFHALPEEGDDVPVQFGSAHDADGPSTLLGAAAHHAGPGAPGALFDMIDPQGHVVHHPGDHHGAISGDADGDADIDLPDL